MLVKTFESYSRYDKVLNKIKNAKVGDVLPNSDIYLYVEYLNDKSKIHTHSENFIDGDLGDRIDEYDYYILQKIPINYIDINEWDTYDDEIDLYQKVFQKTKDYPPIVISSYNSIIDGTHRANALYNSGETEILAFIGIDK
jgi:hypothetical protein